MPSPPGAQPDAVALLSNDNVLPAATRTYLVDNHHSGGIPLGIGNQGSNALRTAHATIDITSQLRGHDRNQGRHCVVASGFTSSYVAATSRRKSSSRPVPDRDGGAPRQGKYSARTRTSRQAAARRPVLQPQWHSS